MGPLFVSLNLCHLLYLYFSIYCFPTKRTASFCESLCPPSVFTRSTTFSFSPSLFPSFDWTLPASFSVLGKQTTCGEVNTIPSLYCLQHTQCNITDLSQNCHISCFLKSLCCRGVRGDNIFKGWYQFVMQSCFFYPSKWISPSFASNPPINFKSF